MYNMNHNHIKDVYTKKTTRASFVWRYQENAMMLSVHLHIVSEKFVQSISTNIALYIIPLGTVTFHIKKRYLTAA